MVLRPRKILYNNVSKFQATLITQQSISRMFASNAGLKRNYSTIQETTKKFRELLPVYEKIPAGKYEKRFMEQLFPADNLKITIKEQEIPGRKITAQRRLDGLEFEQRVATIYALLQGNELDKAEKLIHQLYRLNKNEMTKILNVKIFNQFIESFLKQQYDQSIMDPDYDTDNESRAQEWLVSMQTDFNCNPNLHTFALFVSHYLSVRKPEQAWEYIEKMIEMGFTTEKLRNDPCFDDDILQAALTTLLQSRGFADSELDPKMDHILESALIDTYSLKNKEQEYKDSDELEELIPTKTIGVKILKSALKFRSHEKEFDLYERQSWLETRTHTAARNQFMAAQEKIPEASRKLNSLPNDLITVWHQNYQKKFEEKIKENNPELESILPFLRLVAPEAISKICISEILKHPGRSEKHGVPMDLGEVSALKLAINIAESMEREHNLEQMNSKKNQKLLNLQKNVHKIHSTGKLFNMTLRKAVTKLAQDESQSLDWKPMWGIKIKTLVGTFLLKLCIEVAYIPLPEPSVENEDNHVWVPALSHEKKNIDRGWVMGVIKIHPYLFDLIGTNHSFVAQWSLPMLVPPLPWLTYKSGGYLNHRFPLVRTGKNEEHKRYIKEADRAKHLETMKLALDSLGTTPWVINRNVYEVAAYFWNRNYDMPCLPAISTLPEIQKPEDFDTNPQSAREFKLQKKKRDLEIASRFSDRCSANYKLEIAKSMMEETIYFPHNVDFRGRAYPLPPHLNHMGDDLCRGLLLFKERKPLGEMGLRWLKIHVSNLAGYDKASMDERVAYTENNLDNILASARDPYASDAWWRKGDNPWQLLSAVFELEQALACEDPTTYESNLHIHQDGSCNGLQHYAALGGDLLGAKAVNLAPSPRPGDVYSEVARGVQALIDADCDKGVAEALLMKNRINRKVVKQTVMTNTYGVTFIGARDQIKARLKEARVNESPETSLTDSEIASCATYTAKQVFASMGQMFTGAREIQVWLNTTARLVTKSVPVERIDAKELELYATLLKYGIIDSNNVQKESGLLDAAEHDSNLDLLEEVDEIEKVEIIKLNTNKNPLKITSMTWTTPLGFPIVQPYRNQGSHQIKTFLQTFNVHEHTSTCPVNSMKQASAFPPNFVHSLDASHMMITAVAAKEQGLTFAAVHDSYWTHACDIEKMNKILREAFIQLHSKKIMQNLRQELLSRMEDHRVKVRIEIKDKALFQSAMKSLGLKGGKKFVDVWVPVVPPELPATGTFDIQEVRDSKYFFH